MLSAIRCYLLPIIKLYLLALKVLLVQLLSRPFRLPVMPRQDGKVAIVTGGGRGIGYEVVRHMARLGAHVIIGGRDEQEGLAAVRRICEEYKEAKALHKCSPVELVTGHCESFTWKQAVFLLLGLQWRAAESRLVAVCSFKERDLPLNILVNNGRTEDGFEQHFGVNYLGHFLLTWLLLDTLKDSGKCGYFSRVVNVSSSAHRIGEIRLNDLNSCQSYSAHAAYCHSKLAQLWFSSHLHQELQCGGFPLSSCAVDPGMGKTLRRHHCAVCRPLQLSLWETSVQLLGLQ
ncbi:Dehydrogenase/reductase SDR family member on chromosome X [Dissostichus eleginoides]|uniref:Dehydrogenase/reductase SDR family member on chromosome X n=1 Tax=Dissostichus eleginoides TaxID=100907 RepID=A0AAD9FL79_DISEL|nr:Dehydrogenase/reductase SDR family member on chromosome X [Dissostichus eleginoides]